MDARNLRASFDDWLVDGDRPRPWWVGIGWTIAFCCVIAVGLTVLNMAGSRGADLSSPLRWWRTYRVNAGVSLCIGFVIHFLFAGGNALLGKPRIRRFGPWQRLAYYSLIPIVGVAIGWPIGVSLMLGIDIGQFLGGFTTRMAVSSLLLCGLITTLFFIYFSIRTRQITAEKAASEAKLRLLQAQIEPHFLFNTLANVVSLIEADPPRARTMLESFVDYLRASLSGLGRQTHTLGDELAVVEAYLRVVQTRMDDRLAYAIDVPEALRSRHLPPLSVQPLVENAVVHGLEPSVEGGTVTVRAAVEGERLVVTVSDDGRGLEARAVAGAGSGTGTALANIRERLQQAYGDAASLALAARPPRGTCATLALPYAATAA